MGRKKTRLRVTYKSGDVKDFKSLQDVAKNLMKVDSKHGNVKARIITKAEIVSI